MEPPTSYLPSASLYRPTFSTYMKANPFSKIKAVYLMDHQRRLAELGDRPYLRQMYPELPPHYPGTWCVYSWPDIEAVVDRLYTIPRHWQIPNHKAPPGQARLSVDSPPVLNQPRGRQSRISVEFRSESSLSSSRLTDSTSSWSVGGQRMNQRKYCVTPKSRIQLSNSIDTDAASDDIDDTVSVCSKAYSLLQTISSTDGKIQPVFSKWHKQRQVSGRGRQRRCTSRPIQSGITGTYSHLCNGGELKKDGLSSKSLELKQDSDDNKEDNNRMINDNQREDNYGMINDNQRKDNNGMINDNQREDNYGMINVNQREDNIGMINDNQREDNYGMINVNQREDNYGMINVNQSEDSSEIVNGNQKEEFPE